MSGIICKQCGYENPEGNISCEICAESIVTQSSSPTTIPQSRPEPIIPVAADVTTTLQQTSQSIVDDGNEYSVLCPESHTKTILQNGNVTIFYCEGCKKEHEVDGFLWTIEKKPKVGSASLGGDTCTQSAASPKGDSLWLEEVNSHFRIDIDKAGGTLGRYGKYGADFFQSRGLLMVSGEHCMISYEFGNWVLRHISRTNETKYNNMILGANEPNLIEDGKMITLANKVSFMIRVG